MRHAWFAIAVVLACACSKVDGGAADPTGGCITSTTWQTSSRTLDLGVNDTGTDGTGSLSLAQSFLVPGDTGTQKAVAAVLLPLYYSATGLGGNVTVTLRSNSGTVPSATILSNSTVTQTTTTAITQSSPTLVTFSFSSVQNLDAGSTYWIVLEASYPATSSPTIKWAADDTNLNTSAYSTGHAKYEGDGTPNTTNVFTFGTLGSGRQLGFTITCN